MKISLELQHQIAEELRVDFNGKYDGSRHNLLLPTCPFCHDNRYKYGIYVSATTKYKKFGASHCFKCGNGNRTLKGTLEDLGRLDLIPKETVELEDELTGSLSLFDDDEIDDSLTKIEMPKGYRRCFKNSYLKSRHFIADDYEYFSCGTTRGLNERYDDYVLLEIHDNGRLVGFVGRHTWDKEEIDDYNNRHRYQIRRYNNSTENGFAKLLYNIDAVKQYETRSVILCEGCFDVIALTRKLDLYDYSPIVPVATFGKKISETQIYKLQNKGIDQVVIGYDADAKESISKVAMQLDNYFDVYIADLNMSEGKDWDEMHTEDIYDVFANHIKSVREFNLE